MDQLDLLAKIRILQWILQARNVTLPEVAEPLFWEAKCQNVNNSETRSISTTVTYFIKSIIAQIHKLQWTVGNVSFALYSDLFRLLLKIDIIVKYYRCGRVLHNFEINENKEVSFMAYISVFNVGV